MAKIKSDSCQYILALFILSFIGSAIFYVWRTSNKEHVRMLELTQRENIDNINALIREHNKAKSDTTDTWWITDEPPATLEIYNLIEAKNKQIENLIKMYADTTPETHQISERFKNIKISVLINGLPQEINYDHTKIKYPAGALDIIFLPEKVAMKDNQFLPTFSSVTDALTIPTIEIPESLYAPILFHELGHALRHYGERNLRNVKAMAEKDIMLEEAEMHSLGGEIMNVTSKGAYKQLVNIIVNRAPLSRSFGETIASITEDDLALCDKIFGCSHTQIPGMMLSSQLMIDVGFNYCEKNKLGIDSKFKVYKWLTEYVFLKWTP